MACADLLPALAGRWRLTRRVHAAAGPKVSGPKESGPKTAGPKTAEGAPDPGSLLARMAGEAVFSPPGAAADCGFYRYVETGDLFVADGGAPVAFSRSYLYGAWEQGLDIRFDDGERRPFHRVALVVSGAGELGGEGYHLCPPDTYRSRYRFVMPLAFEIVHAVEGPRKNYVISSRYDRTG